MKEGVEELELQSFATVEEDRAIFTGRYGDFRGSKTINHRMRKYNSKYFVYDKVTREVVVLPEYEPMTVIEEIEVGDEGERIVFYTDKRNKVAFVRTKTKKFYIEKIELFPFYRNISFAIFFRFFFIGIMRCRGYDFVGASFSCGYDKTIHTNIHFVFPEWLRTKLSLKTSKFFLLFHLYWSTIPLQKIYDHYIETSDINTPVYIRLRRKGDVDFIYPMKANVRHRYSKKHYLYNTRSIRLKKRHVELFMRKSITGQYVIVLTSILHRMVPYKEKLAYLLSLLERKKEQYDVYFEKFGEGASESAFCLFQHAVKEGDKCVYILDKKHPNFATFKQQYGKSLRAKNSFAAFYAIFLARSFISSDLVSHLQRRLYDNDRLIKKKILRNHRKIFLQHGPSLATNIFERGYFNRKVPITPDFIVVNSKFERDLFIENTEYTEKDLILTGIPNLDLYTREKDTKKEEITFMLTWRPWDLTGDTSEGSYLGRYFSFMDLVEHHPFYRDKKVNILLHPKSRIILEEQFPEMYEKYHHLFYEGDIKDVMLRTQVLISDYSSLVYYVFAGGSHVVFYWEDKNRAEMEYGGPNTLQEQNAFGDVLYTFEEIQAAVEARYNTDVQASHKARYGQLIEFTDGGNIERTYQYMKEHIV